MDLTNLGDVKRYLDLGAGGINAITITAGGSGYTAATVAASGGAGQGFVGQVILSGGSVVGIAVLNPGFGYVAPTLVISGDGTLATADATADAIDARADGMLTVLVSTASAFLLQRMARKVLLSTDPANPLTELYDGHWQQTRMPLLEQPVQAVTDVQVDGRVIPQSTGPLISGWGFDGRAVFLRPPYCFTDGYDNVQVTYTAGYDPAGSEAAMIGWAANELCAQKWKRRSHIDMNSQSLSGVITTAFNPKDIPPEVQTVINKFSRVPVLG